MSADGDLAKLLRDLEEQLLSALGRASPETIDRLLADDFQEIGSGGDVFGKREALELLAEESGDGHVYERSISDWVVRALTADVALVNYRVVRRDRTDGETASSLRSSIWAYRSGRWQMVFHQGTRLKCGRRAIRAVERTISGYWTQRCLPGMMAASALGTGHIVTTDIFAADYRDQPYWWDDAPRPAPSTEKPPAKVDVLVIGSGYTGLMAARETAGAGRSTLVIDAKDAGFGCSSRNGGQVSTSIKPDLATLSGRHNQEIGFGIRQEGIAALDFIGDLVAREKLDCDWRQVGRFHAAHNPAQYEALAKDSQSQPKGLEVPMEMVPASEQSREIGSDYYHGGRVYPKHASLHPGKYHLELMRLAKSAGAQIIDHCPATNIERDGSGFIVTTGKGKVAARDVVVASNGYTGPITPWQRRRVIPIGSYIIATEARPREEMLKLIPTDRVLSDTRKLVFYYRLSHDLRRMVFGGRVAYMENDPRVSAPRLHRWMTAIFPALGSVKVTHSWMGFVAYTFDTLPHIGKQDGLHYAMGYCGSGISLATYFGAKIGQQVLGKAEGRTPLDNVPFPTRPLYSGNPWFLAPSIFYYQLRDKLPI